MRVRSATSRMRARTTGSAVPSTPVCSRNSASNQSTTRASRSSPPTAIPRCASTSRLRSPTSISAASNPPAPKSITAISSSLLNARPV
jgi:hypothetical protein